MGPVWQRLTVVAVIATCLTYVVSSLIFDTRQGAGPVILVLTSGHGVHAGDLPVLLAWVVGMLGCGWLALREP
ncbi:hypothetical protein [Nocardioides sp.]|uniref:hypothetical protein n=1 Tax=Nocardioides sp. TaxID=35761 RepID=UPI002B2734C5|nr:hypothetical protein [Nocardioides sp.]